MGYNSVDTTFRIESKSSMSLSLSGAKVPGSESDRVRKFQRMKVPGSKCSRERKYQRAKVPPMVLPLLGAKVRGNESLGFSYSHLNCV